jgi:hypothetical protein
MEQRTGAAGAEAKGGTMKKRSILIVALLTVLLVLAFAGTAMAWSHGPAAAPILDRVVGPNSGTWWVSYDVYWDTSGAKPLYVEAVNADGIYPAKILHADLVAGHKTFNLPAGRTYKVYLETRKGVQSNFVMITVPSAPI